jgi:ribonuclease D
MSEHARPEVYVADAATLARLVDELRGEPAFALDTESNGFHAYRERLCLLQISTRAADYIVDPLTADPAPLREVFEDPARTVIIHAAEGDVMALKRDHALRIAKLFDTQAAARILGKPAVGLSDLLQNELGVAPPKDEQRSDWGRRPLTRDQLAYAYADTRHLHLLHERLAAELDAKKLRDVAEAEFRRLIAKEPRERVFDTDGYLRLAGGRKLDGRGLAVLRALWLARDARAKEVDVPPFKVLGEQAMLEIAPKPPRTDAELERVKGVTPGVLRRFGAGALMRAIHEGVQAPPVERRAHAPQSRRGGPGHHHGPGGGRPDPAEDERYEKLRAWRKARAAETGIPVEMVAPNAVLRAIARERPRDLESLARIPGMDDFRLERYGRELIEASAG